VPTGNRKPLPNPPRKGGQNIVALSYGRWKFIQFKATLARKKARKEKNQGKFDRKKLGFKFSIKEYNFPQLSESELETVKTDIRRQIKAQNRIEYITLLALLVLVFLFLVYLNFPFN